MSPEVWAFWGRGHACLGWSQQMIGHAYPFLVCFNRRCVYTHIKFNYIKCVLFGIIKTYVKKMKILKCVNTPIIRILSAFANYVHKLYETALQFFCGFCGSAFDAGISIIICLSTRKQQEALK